MITLALGLMIGAGDVDRAALRATLELPFQPPVISVNMPVLRH